MIKSYEIYVVDVFWVFNFFIFLVDKFILLKRIIGELSCREEYLFFGYCKLEESV